MTCQHLTRLDRLDGRVCDPCTDVALTTLLAGQSWTGGRNRNSAARPWWHTDPADALLLVSAVLFLACCVIGGRGGVA